VILVPQVNVTLVYADGRGGYQEPLQEAVRVPLQVAAVLEGPRLAFVDVSRHEPRPGLLPDYAPLAPGREAGPAQAAQAGVFQGLYHHFRRALSGDYLSGQAVAASRAIGGVAGVSGLGRARPREGLPGECRRVELPVGPGGRVDALSAADGRGARFYGGF